MPANVTSRVSGVPPSSAAPLHADLPEYRPLAFNLTREAHTKLTALSTKYAFKDWHENLKKGLDILTENVAAINDNVSAKKHTVTTRREKLEAQENRTDGDDKELETMEGDLTVSQEKVAAMTKRLEENFRKMIDAQQTLYQLKDALETLPREMPFVEARNIHNSRDVQSQQPQTDGVPASSTADDDTLAAFTPTDPSGGPTQIPSTNEPPPPPRLPLQKFRDIYERKASRYLLYTSRQRYAENNDYRQFRRVLHDAEVQDASIPMPHESTWFTAEEGNAPHPGETRIRPTNQDEDDDDLAIAQVTISTKCPITFLDFVDPVTSRNCPHSFEKDAILQMIATSDKLVAAPNSPNDGIVIDGSAEPGHDGNTPSQTQIQVSNPIEALIQHGRTRNRNATQHARSDRNATAMLSLEEASMVQAIQCPVQGCASYLLKADLYTDQVLIRQIARLQRAKRLREEEDGEEDGRKNKRTRDGKSIVTLASDGPEAIDDSDEDDDVVDIDDEIDADGEEVVTSSRKRFVKGERAL